MKSLRVFLREQRFFIPKLKYVLTNVYIYMYILCNALYACARYEYKMYRYKRNFSNLYKAVKSIKFITFLRELIQSIFPLDTGYIGDGFSAISAFRSNTR